MLRKVKAAQSSVAAQAEQSDDLARLRAQIRELQRIRNDREESEATRLLAEEAILQRLKAALGYKPLFHPAHHPENLQSVKNGDSVNVQPKEQPLSTRLPFLTVDDIKKFIGYDKLLSILRRTENLAVLKLAHELASELKREVEVIVKERLWNGDAPEGELYFNSIPRANRSQYFNAKVRGSTRGLPREHFTELEQARQAATQRHKLGRESDTPDHLTPDQQ